MAYWTAKSVPELAGLERKEQGRLFRQCLKEGKSAWAQNIGSSLG